MAYSTLRTFTNKIGTFFSVLKTTRIYAEDLNKIGANFENHEARILYLEQFVGIGSRSPSISPSLSPSVSLSESPSISPSPSASPSLSPSASISPSAPPSEETLIPIMTGYTSPSGVVLYSDARAGYEAWKAFKRDNTYDGMIWSVDGQPQYFGYDFGSGNEKIVTKISYDYSFIGETYCIRSFQFQGSNDLATWDTYYSRLGWPDGGDADEAGYKEHVLSNTTAYRYYRWYVTDTYRGKTSAFMVADCQMYGS